MSNFSKSLKTLRKELNMTMQSVADKACVSKSMICKIESEEVQPTLDVAARIACALNKTLSEMMHAPQSAAIVFLPKDQQAVWEDARHIKRRNISPVFEGLKLEWLHVELPEKTGIETCQANATGVEKYILVTIGELEVYVNQERYLLKEGDSIYFDASCPHQYLNNTGKKVELYILVNRNRHVS
jgi:transcriptional regulator with XRE-family HTH domain